MIKILRLIPLCLLLPLTACGKGDFFAVAPKDITVTNIPDPTLTFYAAYGDSITAGYGVADPAQDFVSLVSAYNSLPQANPARGGDQACDLAPAQLPLTLASQRLGGRLLNTILIGTNDTLFAGTGAVEATFNLCHQAAIAWLAVPETAKRRATDPAVTHTGATHLELGIYDSLVTDAQGATATFPLTTPAAGPIYIWYQIIDASPGTFTYAVDGQVLGTRTTAGPTRIKTLNGSTNSMALLRIPAIPAGAHTVTFTQTSPGTYGLGVLAVGAPPVTPAAKLARVLVGTVPPQSYGRNSGAVAAYNGDIQTNVALLLADGLNLTLFTPSTYMSGTTDLNDTVHPNALGYREIFKSIEDALGNP